MQKLNLFSLLFLILIFVLFELVTYAFLTSPALKIDYQVAAKLVEPKAATLADLNKIVIALERYRYDKRSYPKSESKIPSGWVGLFDYNGVENRNWIPNLEPDYLFKLPRDPRITKIFEDQYLYQSNGANYKITASHPADCEYIKSAYPQLIDPMSSQCRYGYWTPVARNWRY